jgi:hypothetical protein
VTACTRRLLDAIAWQTRSMSAPGDDWRIEAGEEWLAAHSSQAMSRLNKRLRRMGVVGDAVSMAELGPFGGAPRKPNLHPGPKRYSVVRFVVATYSYTAISVELERCGRCGGSFLEVHRALRVREDGAPAVIGEVRMCRGCQRESWMFHSHMPTTAKRRLTSRKVVL